ncbi:MAG TPA: type III PLP-dependent enzyme [Pseudonocardiaceae bacterium]|jgi:diaminopimelate decarboxylase|nr:type III PLP-dependent enzyme [Pseudonocardiaceae bacterium]
MRDLVARFGSPLYVYQLDRIADAHADLCSALPQPSTLYYSVKANPHPDLVRALGRAGCPVEISSAGEVRAATAAGAGAALGDSLYTGPAKTEHEIAVALRGGVRLFSAESMTDLLRISRAAQQVGVRARCLVRVNAPAVGATRLRMTGTASQFGIDIAQLLADPPWRHDIPGVDIVGAHFFALSNVRDEASLLASFGAGIATAATLAERGLRLEVLDLGGGFAAPYAEPGDRPRYDLRPALTAELDARLPGWRAGRPRIAFESGRYLVGDCGSLVCAAMEWKDGFLLLDSGINHLGGIGGLGRVLRPTATPLSAGTARATVVGPLCTPADVLGRDVPVDPVGTGEPVVFPNVGAYGLTASLVGFLSRPAPAEIVLRGTEIVSATRLALVRNDLGDGRL